MILFFPSSVFGFTDPSMTVEKYSKAFGREIVNVLLTVCENYIV